MFVKSMVQISQIYGNNGRKIPGKCDLKIMADCCWCLKHDEVEINQCVKFLQRKYLP